MIPPEVPPNPLRSTTYTLNPIRCTRGYRSRIRKILSKDTRKTSNPPSSLYVSSTLCSHNLSDFVYYQAVLSSVISTALAIGTRPELKTDRDVQTAALHAILLALNNSAAPVVPSPRKHLPARWPAPSHSSRECPDLCPRCDLRERLNGHTLEVGALAICREADRQRTSSFSDSANRRGHHTHMSYMRSLSPSCLDLGVIIGRL